MGGVPGVSPAKVVVIGGGVVGENAVEMALGLGAEVTVLDRSLACARSAGGPIRGRARRRSIPPPLALEELVLDADLVVGAVLVKGDRAPTSGHRRDGEGHAPRLGPGRRRHRPGRLLRDLSPDHPQRTRPSSSTTWCTTASPTCRERCRGHRPTR